VESFRDGVSSGWEFKVSNKDSENASVDAY